MLTPMQVQYLVGPCCLQRNPTAVNVTVGDMVSDAASGTERDVDITVTVHDGPDTVRAFKGYEVKREASPLDVAAVEQLCIKFKDMPSVTHPAIVSASGYTGPALQKAASHDVALYEIRPWTQPVASEFPALSMRGAPEESFQFGKALLYWLPGYRIYLVAPRGPESFQADGSTTLLSANGGGHDRFPTLSVFFEEILFRSTTILYVQDPAAMMRITSPRTIVAEPEPNASSPPWPHTHTIDVARDGLFLSLNGRLVAIEYVTISGHLQWQSKAQVSEYHVLSRVPDGEIFAGAAIAGGLDDDELLALIIEPDSRRFGIHRIRLTEKQRNAIRGLKLQPPA